MSKVYVLTTKVYNDKKLQPEELIVGVVKANIVAEKWLTLGVNNHFEVHEVDDPEFLNKIAKENE